MGRRELRWSVVAAWLVSRGWLFLVTLDVLYDPYPIVKTDVSGIYEPWFQVLRDGTFPIEDVMWQYPPGAAGVLLLPGLLPMSYPHAFFTLMLLSDAVAFACLLRGRSLWGAALWTAAVPLLGPMILSRYDLLVTALAVAALLASARRPWAGGLLTGVAAAVKVWPVLLLVGAPRGRRFLELAVWTLIGAAAVVCGFAAAMPGAFDFLSAQRDRGVEVESVFATPFHIARFYGWSGRVSFNYGSMEFLGPQVSLVGRLSLAASALALMWLLLWRIRARVWTPATQFDAALTAVLLFVVTSRVLSPQYLVWLVGLAAVCLTRRETSQRPVAALILLAVPLTTWEFPVWFGWVITGEPEAVTVLLLRNALLVAAAVWSAVRLWRAGRPAIRHATAPRTPAEADAPADPPAVEPVGAAAAFRASDWPPPAPREVSPSPAPARSVPPSTDASRTALGEPGSG
ncbi:glycosyltransferase 87 family protein [Yinghuangia seranimata]|uniref:glycosyltransferase 87 family protein n=1 Tax=Yinghuangia seranimata TaxID=408067 RepID=UPI003CCF9275